MKAIDLIVLVHQFIPLCCFQVALRAELREKQEALSQEDCLAMIWSRMQSTSPVGCPVFSSQVHASDEKVAEMRQALAAAEESASQVSDNMDIRIWPER